MDKNTITGFILIILVFIGFYYLNRPSQEQLEAQRQYRDSITIVRQQQLQEEQTAVYQRQIEQAEIDAERSDSIQQSRVAAKYGIFAESVNGTEEFITLENDLLILKLTTKGGRVYSAELKNFTDYQNNPLILFQDDEAQFSLTLVSYDNRIIETGDLFFEKMSSSSREATFRLRSEDGAGIDFIYKLHPDDYLLDFTMIPFQLQDYLRAGTNYLDINWMQKMRLFEGGTRFESQHTRLTYKYFSDNVEQLSNTKDESKTIAGKLKWIGNKAQFFSSVLIAKDGFISCQLDTRNLQEENYLRSFKTIAGVDFDPKAANPIDMYYFFGPNDYKLLRGYDQTILEGQDLQLEKLVPLGWSFFRYINKWIIIPIFDWLTSWASIGLAILLLTLIIKTALFPLTYKSFMSSAKMRVMKPQIEVITSKYPGQENAMVRQQKTMELYRQVGINQLSGCLPMLLQMPFLLALFMFFPTCIALRHQGFLWAPDLSTYDAVIKWDTYVPLVSDYFGNHISIFCLLMSIVNVIYTKYNMEQAGTGSEQMPGMKTMMYLMPVFMLVFLNSFPAGLNYYYFVSTLITILQTIVFRFFLNEEALLAKLEANKKNPPKKKSGFMARLEEAQRKQQAMLKEQQKNKNRSRR